jgi:hypothetical protein
MRTDAMAAITPWCTVVIPLYNKQRTIARAIASIRAQTCQDFEVVIVDDGSTDGSLAAVMACGIDADPRFRVVRQANAGPGAARNAGALRARGHCLAFLDADDEWLPGHLQHAFDAFCQPGCQVYVSAYDTGAEHQQLQPNLLQRCITQSGRWRLPADLGPVEVKRMVDACQVSCLVVERALFWELGGFYDCEHSTFGEDIYLVIQLVFAGDIWCERTPQVLFHVEDSELGLKRVGERPIRPHLLAPEPLRAHCPPARRTQLEALFAYYRMLETEKFSRQGDWRAVWRLRRQFHWPGGVPAELQLRECKVPLRAVAAALGLHGGAQRAGG